MFPQETSAVPPGPPQCRVSLQFRLTGMPQELTLDRVSKFFPARQRIGSPVAYTLTRVHCVDAAIFVSLRHTAPTATLVALESLVLTGDAPLYATIINVM